MQPSSSGKAHKPYEFGVKVSITTTNRRAAGGRFVLHAMALPGSPYDGQTLGEVIEETQSLTRREIERAYIDKGYRGHNAPKPLRIFISRQKRGVFATCRHIAYNLTRKAPCKDSIRLRRKTAGWDDEYLASLIAA